ncbi:hypothetical protein G7K_3573-t1 [Saitoella complicata NRRL Y-17804]|uniref:NEDD8-activating enzyme E1 regulatory subunit n=2 Tax=Saitoella complicata (strain BCRC 22490 / CBS 7301 / JCM 7358 / NBRC 10748 / NRRL Y-17804) TaxID=698492 RepID=A0A0E9NHZ3_SAICN|nr:hypothetical protein G7K_3573-t1 [Saitoella complicata NRRL Y-17804]
MGPYDTASQQLLAIDPGYPRPEVLMSETTAPYKIEKSVKFDRQLRLWAASGQAALESAHICLLNATATGTEILKNLVLPGIGAFTIVDGKTVTEDDLAINFFLEDTCLNQSRAQKVSEYLNEMNEDVKSAFLQKDPVEVIASDPAYFQQFSLVIASNLHQEPLLALAKTLDQARIPLVATHTVGFQSMLRLQVEEHTIVESHPESLVDLRLDCPWPELAAPAESLNLEAMDSMEHSHVPYVNLLLYYLQKFKSENDGRIPSTFPEKQKLKEMIKSGMRTADEENFEEAIGVVWRACQATHIPSDVKAVFADPLCQNLTGQSTDFWILARSVADFVSSPTEGNGLLPLPGVVPDMKADSSGYVQLQTLYRKKAAEDVTAVTAHVREHLKAVGRPVDSISADDTASFCKHAAWIKVMRYRSIEEEYASSPKTEKIASALQDSEDLMSWYLALRAHFAIDSSTVNASTLSDAAHKIASLAEPNENVTKACEETARANGGELHNIAALMGGIAAQEVIKVITRQYVPADNTVLFEGIGSRSQTWVM